MTGTKIHDFAPVSDLSLEELVPKNNFYCHLDEPSASSQGLVRRPAILHSQGHHQLPNFGEPDAHPLQPAVPCVVFLSVGFLQEVMNQTTRHS
jgi:hypothetical protein